MCVNLNEIHFYHFITVRKLQNHWIAAFLAQPSPFPRTYIWSPIQRRRSTGVLSNKNGKMTLVSCKTNYVHVLESTWYYVR